MKAEQERLEIALEESRDKQSDCTNGIGGDVTGVGTSCLIDDISRPDGSFSKNQDGEICYCRVSGCGWERYVIAGQVGVAACSIMGVGE